MFLKNKFEVPKTIRYIEVFTGVSGLNMNLDKSVLFPLKAFSNYKVICNPKEQGGLEVLDYNTLNDTFKIK